MSRHKVKCEVYSTEERLSIHKILRSLYYNNIKDGNN